MVKPFCPAPFHSVFVNSQGNVAPCAQWPQSWNMSIDQWLTSPELKDIQDRFLRDNYFQPECSKCESNACSEINYDWHGHLKRDQSVFHIDYTPDNLCNLSCLMCSPSLSTGVGSEYKKIGWIDQIPKINNYKKVTDYFRKLDKKNVRIVVCGGEPFMNPQFAELLELIRDKQWGVCITTNASIKNQRAMDALRDIEDVTLELSADGVGSSYDAIRYPMTWNKWAKNFKYYINHIKKRKISNICIRYVVNFFNAHDYYKMCNFANDNRVLTNPCLLSWPEWMSWSVLTDLEKEMMIKNIESNRDNIQYQNHKNYLTIITDYINQHAHDSNLRKEFIYRYLTICKSRNINPQVYLGHLPTLQKEFNDAFVL